MPKLYLLLLVLTVILSTSFLIVAVNSGFTKLAPKSEIDTAINQAKYLYHQKRARGEDFSNGPCLSNAVLPNWVADLVHNPRLHMDDLPQNQCPAYLEGTVQHFVELDLDGNLIRAR